MNTSTITPYVIPPTPRLATKRTPLPKKFDLSTDANANVNAVSKTESKNVIPSVPAKRVGLPIPPKIKESQNTVKNVTSTVTTSATSTTTTITSTSNVNTTKAIKNSTSKENLNLSQKTITLSKEPNVNQKKPVQQSGSTKEKDEMESDPFFVTDVMETNSNLDVKKENVPPTNSKNSTSTPVSTSNPASKSTSRKIEQEPSSDTPRKRQISQDNQQTQNEKAIKKAKTISSPDDPKSPRKATTDVKVKVIVTKPDISAKRSLFANNNVLLDD
jgi:hypothetical protein